MREYSRAILIGIACTCMLHKAFLAEVLRQPVCRRYCTFQNMLNNRCLKTRIVMEDSSVAADPRNWSFSSSILRQLPIVSKSVGYVGPVPGAAFSDVPPLPFDKPAKLIAYSPGALALLDLDPSVVDSQDFVDLVSGTRLYSADLPLAHRYGGHQFGVWANQLGDGRALTLGEYVNAFGERWELQLKGSGQTPYSRLGDGRAVLRSSVREFLCSEHMHALGVPTSRAASLVVSDDTVMRDQFYSGRPKQEKSAIVLRLMPTWFRIGSLELPYKRGELDLLRQLTHFIIEHYFRFKIDSGQPWNQQYLDLYNIVLDRTAFMVAKWMCVGFAHGVMNTDNFSVLGFTIDYGPFGFLDEYNPRFIPNSSDDEGRYSFQRQPDVAHFNMEKLKLALSALLDAADTNSLKIFDAMLAQFKHRYDEYYLDMMAEKLGIRRHLLDHQFLDNLLDCMDDTGSDFTMTFRQLANVSADDLLVSRNLPDELWAVKRLEKCRGWTDWAAEYCKRIQASKFASAQERIDLMNSVNPRYVLRNWMAELAIRQANQGDFDEVELQLAVLSKPFTEQEQAEVRGYADPPPTWASSLRVSCSS